MATNSRSSSRGRGRTGRSSSTSSRRGTSRTTRRTSQSSGSRSRTSRSRTSSRGGRSTRGRSSNRSRTLPRRDANGRFIKRRVQRRARPTPRRRPTPTRRVRMPTTSVVREASRRSVAGPALVKRKWWRVDGPVDANLPEGYAYQR